MIYILLQLKTYRIIVKATSKKHFDLLDAGAEEIQNGSWCAMLDLDREMSLNEENDLIMLKTDTSLIQTSEECLQLILDINPDYLNNKTFL